MEQGVFQPANALFSTALPDPVGPADREKFGCRYMEDESPISSKRGRAKCGPSGKQSLSTGSSIWDGREQRLSEKFS